MLNRTLCYTYTVTAVTEPSKSITYLGRDTEDRILRYIYNAMSTATEANESVTNMGEMFLFAY